MCKWIVSNIPDDMDEDELKGIFESSFLEQIDLKPGKYAVLTFDDSFLFTDEAEEWNGKPLLFRGHWIKIKPAKW